MTRPFDPCDYIELHGKKYLYLNSDRPSEAYRTGDPCFVAQPLVSNSETYNVIPVPLMMTDEWKIIEEDPDLVSRLRSTPKEYDFTFVGQTNYAGREVFKNLRVKKYDFEQTKSVYNLSDAEKRKTLREFLYRTAKSTFTFAPRGIGSSSFRIYQSLMVGSIPIVTGMNDYPFKDQVDWDAISIRGDLCKLSNLIDKALGMSESEISRMREAGMSFWDNYCRHDKLHEKLGELV